MRFRRAALVSVLSAVAFMAQDCVHPPHIHNASDRDVTIRLSYTDGRSFELALGPGQRFSHRHSGREIASIEVDGVDGTSFSLNEEDLTRASAEQDIQNLQWDIKQSEIVWSDPFKDPWDDLWGIWKGSDP